MQPGIGILKTVNLCTLKFLVFNYVRIFLAVFKPDYDIGFSSIG